MKEKCRFLGQAAFEDICGCPFTEATDPNWHIEDEVLAWRELPEPWGRARK